MPAYDAVAFRPPAPVAHVVVRSPATGKIVADVPMLIDTGADVSLLPRETVVALLDPQSPNMQVELLAFDGSATLAQATELEVQFLGKVFRGQYVLIDGVSGILGRNVLNSLSLLMEGPSRSWREHR